MLSNYQLKVTYFYSIPIVNVKNDGNDVKPVSNKKDY